MGADNLPGSLAGFHAPHVDPIYKRLSTVIGATMWFWIFYRAKEDGGALIVRAERPDVRLRCLPPVPPLTPPRPPALL